jgi:hypothetical protein
LARAMVMMLKLSDTHMDTLTRSDIQSKPARPEVSNPFV